MIIKGTVTGITKEVVTTYEITRDSVTDEIVVGKRPNSTASNPAIHCNTKKMVTDLKNGSRMIDILQ